MKESKGKLFFLVALFILFFQTGYSQDQKIFLIGDAGENTPEAKAIINDLVNKVQEDPQNSTVVFLGDNLYPKGMPPVESKKRPEAEQTLRGMLSPLIEAGCRIILIPGNHDWEQGNKGGYQAVLRQEKFLDSLSGGKQLMFPGGGCPGPEVIMIRKDIVLVLIDTQWLLHRKDRPGTESDCPIKTGLDMYANLEGILKEHRNRKVIVAGHHPIYSYGIHGGRSNLKMHLFPLTDASPNLYLPLPIVGSLYPAYRKYAGSIQDLAHPAYKVYSRSVSDLFEAYPNTIYASGHDHSLQYISKDKTQYIVSGSGSKSTYVKNSKKADFTSRNQGYSELAINEKGDVSLSFYTVQGRGVAQEFNKLIFSKPPPAPRLTQRTEKLPETVHRAGSKEYLANGFKRWLLGENYRTLWATELDFRVFDVKKEKGGLEILKRGGGMQTKSLRMEATDEKQYVLRSINKDPAKAIPPMLRGSFAQDVVQDQISAAHPYGAFVIPTLAEGAGIYHTNPEPVMIPDDPELGKYRDDFANVLALYEERPAGNWSDSKTFGSSKDIINTTKVLKKIHGDNDHLVDQKFVLKNRLFDLWIGDWDRHDDQWRWATFKGEYGKIFRPIPRDRDQAFFLNEGILPKIASRKWALPKFQGFYHELRNVPGFMFNARWFDRSFMNGLEKEDWEEVAESHTAAFTDELIDSALFKWPKPIYDQCGKEIKSKLVSRRLHLKEYAMDYYRFLAREVDVLGSDKNELFKVQRQADGNTLVEVYKISKKGNQKQMIYKRNFLGRETREIRLFGLDGKDKFEISGKAKKGIRLRVIGGEGEDEIQDNSRIRGLTKRTLYYDTKRDNRVDLGKEGRNRTSNRPGVNLYDRKSFQYNVAMPLAWGAFNVDDGIYIGGGALITTHGFRKDPFKNQHYIRGIVAFRTGGFDFRYHGQFNQLFGKLDLVLGLDLEGPNYTRNFFGLGNESVYDRDNSIQYYYVRFDNFIGSALLRRRISDFGAVLLGPIYENIEVRRENDRFITDISNITGNDTIFEQKQFAGLQLGFEIDTRDSKIFPKRGVHLNVNGKSMQPVDDQAFYYSRIQGSFSFYLSFRSPKTITISNRTGGGYTDGDNLEFYQANTIGGTGKEANLRGYRRTRFYGESSFFNNTDVRITLFGFKTYLFPANFGLVGFYDIGRVWVDGENSDVWHTGYGFGIWLTPFESITLEADLAYGEFWLPAFRFGFLF